MDSGHQYACGSLARRAEVSYYEKKKNIRVDKLLRILRSAETNYFWKWTRTKMGIRQHADKRWLAMRGDDVKDTIPPNFYGDCTPLETHDGVPEYEDRSTLFKQRLKECLTDCLELISRKAVDSERLKIMVKQLSVTRNVLRNAPLELDLVTDPPVARLLTTDTNQREYVIIESRKKRKLDRQKTRYKKRKSTSSVTSIKSLKKDINRSNLAFSMQFSAVGWNSLRTPAKFPDTSELQLDLSVVRKGTVLTLGGVIFLPVITGMVVPDSGTSFGFEVLNMRVANVYLDSEAHRGGVHKMHYLYKLCTLQPEVCTRSRKRSRSRIGREQVIGSIQHRHHYSNTLRFDELTSRVDSILTDSLRGKYKVRVTLLTYT